MLAGDLVSSALIAGPETLMSEIGSVALNGDHGPVHLDDAHLETITWTETAHGVVSPELGTPITLTWSLPPDGTWIPGSDGRPASTNSFITAMNERFGSVPGAMDQQPWFPLLQRAFDAWSEVSGVTFVYEPNDDGAPHVLSAGVLGVRGDVRLGAGAIDGQHGILALSYFPNHGEVVADHADILSAPDENYVVGILVHEIGHALGLRHLHLLGEMQTVMSPIYDPSVYELQVYDVFLVTTEYGDIDEPNNDPINASVIDVLAGDVSLERTISGAADIDLFEFTLADETTINLTLSSTGQVFEQIHEGEVSAFDTITNSDLRLELVDELGSTVAVADDAGVGGVEVIEMSLGAGTYIAQVTGAGASAQTYQLITSSELNSPNTIQVTSFADDMIPDDGLTTLREAVAIATQSPQAMTISLRAGTYRLDAPLDITVPMELVGAGQTATTIEGPANGRIFNVSADFQLSGLTAAGGHAFDQATIGGHWYGGGGGALRAYEADVHISDVLFRDNSSDMPGGAVLGINSSISIVSSVFAGNSGHYGGAIHMHGGSGDISKSMFSNNTANQGGAIGNAANTVISTSLFVGNSAGTLASGGGTAIFNFDTPATELTVVDSEFSSHHGRGGVINSSASSHVSIQRTTIAENSNLEGGGSIFVSGPATIVSSTISNNEGQGIYVSPGGDVVIDSVTVADNTLAGLINAGNTWNYGTTTVRNSIFADNGVSGDVFGVIDSGGGNVVGVGDYAAGFAVELGDTIGSAQFPIDLLLEPLASNGGATRTRLLSPGSPARDAGGHTSEVIDQRGHVRFQDSTGDGFVANDSGAVEMPSEGAVAEAPGELTEKIRLPAELAGGNGWNMWRSEAEGALTRLVQTGGSIFFDVMVTTGGLFGLNARTSNDNYGDLEVVSVFVDGEFSGTFRPQDTGDFGHGWNVFTTNDQIAVTLLSEGQHHIEFLVGAGDSYGVEFDWVEIEMLESLPTPMIQGGVLIEGNSAGQAPLVKLSHAVTYPIEFSITATPGTAGSEDFLLLGHVIRFAAGQTEQQLPLLAVPDHVREGVERFDIVLTRLLDEVETIGELTIIDDQPATTEPIAIWVEPQDPDPFYVFLHIYGLGLGGTLRALYPTPPSLTPSVPGPIGAEEAGFEEAGFEDVGSEDVGAGETSFSVSGANGGGVDLQIPRERFDAKKPLQLDHEDGATLVVPNNLPPSVGGIRRGSGFTLVEHGGVHLTDSQDEVVFVKEGGQVIVESENVVVFGQDGATVTVTEHGHAEVLIESGATLEGNGEVTANEVLHIGLSLVNAYSLPTPAIPTAPTMPDSPQQPAMPESGPAPLMSPVLAAPSEPQPTHEVTDVNRDGVVGIRDALVVLNALRGMAVTNDVQPDVNGDGRISLIDATVIFARITKAALGGQSEPPQQSDQPNHGPTATDLALPAHLQRQSSVFDQIFVPEEETDTDWWLDEYFMNEFSDKEVDDKTPNTWQE